MGINVIGGWVPVDSIPSVIAKLKLDTEDQRHLIRRELEKNNSPDAVAGLVAKEYRKVLGINQNPEIEETRSP
jgi:hypothetical protein